MRDNYAYKCIPTPSTLPTTNPEHIPMARVSHQTGKKRHIHVHVDVQYMYVHVGNCHILRTIILLILYYSVCVQYHVIRIPSAQCHGGQNSISTMSWQSSSLPIYLATAPVCCVHSVVPASSAKHGTNGVNGVGCSLSPQHIQYPTQPTQTH